MLPDPRIQLSGAVTKSRARLGLDRLTVRSLARRLRRAGTRLGLSAERWSSLTVRIVDDAEMSDLHVRFMGEGGPTDVLSFPADDMGELLGDIALDWEAVRRQAPLPTPGGWLDEATVLCVHGLVHLVGHDHRDAIEGRIMHRVEAKLLRAIEVPDVPRPYARVSCAASIASAGRTWS